MNNCNTLYSASIITFAESALQNREQVYESTEELLIEISPLLKSKIMLEVHASIGKRSLGVLYIWGNGIRFLFRLDDCISQYARESNINIQSNVFQSFLDSDASVFKLVTTDTISINLAQQAFLHWVTTLAPINFLDWTDNEPKFYTD